MAMLTRVRAAVDRAHWWEAVLSGDRAARRLDRGRRDDDDYLGRGAAADRAGTAADDAGEDPRPS